MLAHGFALVAILQSLVMNTQRAALFSRNHPNLECGHKIPSLWLPRHTDAATSNILESIEEDQGEDASSP
jgi:hypothetical protein